jgi:hypothetical protein
MKARILLLVFGFTLILYGQVQDPGGTTAPPLPPNSFSASSNESPTFAVTSRGPHSRIWQSITSGTNALGQSALSTNSYSELATGICYWNGNQWVDSSDQIQLTGNGASATNTQHQVAFAANINDSGAISLTTPDGQQMTSHILGLVYVDSSSGTNVLFAETQDSIGGLLTSGNQIIYTNAFTNADCDVLYTHKLSGLEQDIIIRQQLPSPASYGLTGSNIWLQVWTEFPTSPAPQATQMQNGDNFLDFGVMKMGRGKAFMLGSSLNGVPVVKSWITSQGRTFLIESVLLNSIASQLSQLPAFSSSSGSSNSVPGSGSSGSGDQSRIRRSRSSLASLAPPRPDFKNLRLPPPKVAKKSPAAMYLAASTLAQNGLVVDYNIENGSLTDFTFQGDTTYFITNTVDLYGSCVIEGGTVIKFSTNTSASIISGYGTNLTCKTGPYRPAIFTAQDDNSVGDQISGSTGTPTNYYGGVGIKSEFGGSVTWKNLRFSYLREALDLEVNASYLYDIQFNNCQNGLYLDTVAVSLLNALFCNVATDFVCVPDPVNLDLENVTIHNSTLFCDMVGYEGYTYTGDPGNWPNFTADFINCLLVDVTNTGPPIGVYSYTTTNAIVILTNDAGVFQTVGAGSHYLATNTYRGLGTTNVLSAELLAELRQKTTWPPLVMSNVVISNNTTLGPYAYRDTNISTLDLGYHYDPLDYIMDACTVTNATLSFTNGVGIGYFSDAVGALFLDGSALVSVGTPLAPNWFTSYQMVREQCVTIGSGSSAYYLYPYHYGSTGPNGFIQFSKFSGGSGNMLYNADPNSYTSLLVQDCEFWAGGCIFNGSTNSGAATVIDNCLFVRSLPNIQTPGSGSVNIAFSNNLVWCATFPFWGLSSDTFYAFNNVFDSCSILLGHGTPVISNGYNAYLNCTSRLSPTNGPDNAFDIVTNTSLAYQTGPLGFFYQPTNSILINMGSTNANLVGLYHFTTQTNQVEESNSIVDIGYHYVAVDTSGQPIDANSNGIPDYLENPDGPAPPFILSEPASLSVLKGNSGSFTVVAAGDGPLVYQWAFNGTNISGATSSGFTANNVQSANAGDYSVTITNLGGSAVSSNAVLTVIPPSCEPLPANAVSWWSAETNAADNLGTNNGTRTGTSGYTNGMDGQAFNFQSTGEGVYTPTGSFPTGTADRTMECWVYISSFISGAETFFAGYGDFGNNGGTYEFGVATDQHFFFSQWGASIEGPVLTTNQWYHVVVTSISTNTITLYLDGTNVASGSLSFNTPSGATNFIGSVVAPYATRQLIGRIDELTIYNRALTSNEIMSIYEAGSAGKCPLTGTNDPYLVLCDSSLTNYTFQSDTTYLICGAVNLYGTTTIEGGTVIKYALSAFTNHSSGGATGPTEITASSLVLMGTNLVWKTAPYRPAIFTAVDDDSVGAIISGSTGVPGTNYYGHLALNLSALANPTVSCARFCNLYNPLQGSGITLQDVQAVNCSILFNGEGLDHYLQNVLLNRVGIVSDVAPGGVGSDTLVAQNLTAHNCGTLMVNTNGSVYLTNSLLVNVTNWQAGTFLTNHTAVLSNDTGIFQTVGNAGHYLAAASVYRSAGTSAINPGLLTDLGQKTTYPPIVIPSGYYSTTTSFNPQVQRDTNSGPDLGYHYDPIDYAFGAVYVTNATLTVTPGTVIAGFSTNGIGYSLAIGAGGQLLCQGAPTEFSRIVNYNTVQEPFATNWSIPQDGLLLPNFSGGSPSSVIFCRFTDFSILAQDTAHFNGMSGTSVPVSFRDCQFHGGAIYSPYVTVNLTNCLLERVVSTLGAADGGVTYLYNNLFWGGTFDAYLGLAGGGYVQDNMFDRTTITDDGNYTGGWNGYVTNNDLLSLTYTNDVVLSNSVYQTSWLGTYYLPTNSPLLHKGSTNANLLGLYQYTTQTNEIKEATNIVSIGYHYVAVDTNGNPVSTLWLGIPDYLVDTNGNGATNLINWQINYFGYVGLNPNGDPYGQCYTLLQDYQSGLDPSDPICISNVMLGYWRFNTNSWVGEQGQHPIVATNLQLVASWSTNAVLIDTTNLANLKYHDIETNANANIDCRNGSVSFWFSPDWSSSNGPGGTNDARLIELGIRNTTNVWWALVLNTNGTQLKFITQTNGAGITNLTATINWQAWSWHQVVVTYTNNNSSLYIDGLPVVTNGFGVTNYPSPAVRASTGLNIGSDLNGTNQARGRFDELKTYNYVLSAATVSNNYAPPCFPSVDVVMLVDVSAIMGDFTPGNLCYATNACSNIIWDLNSSYDQAGLVSFTNGAMTNQILTTNMTTNLFAIGSLVTNSASSISMSNAISSAQALLAGSHHNPQSLPIIVLMSEVANTDNTNGIIAAATAAKNAGTRFISFTLGITNAMTNLMGILASSPSDNHHGDRTDSNHLNSEYIAIASSIVTSLCRPDQPPVITITSPTNGQRFPYSPTNILITASASPTLGTITNVEFLNSGTELGATNSTPYQVLWTNVSGGSYTLTAIAFDSDGLDASNSVSISVNIPPTVGITSPTNGQAFLGPTNITLLATATDSDGTISQVLFYNGTNLLGTATAGATNTYSFAWTNAPSGTNQLYAVATDNEGLSTISSPVAITVSYPPSASITSPTNGNQFNYGVPVTVTATASVGDTNHVLSQVQLWMDSSYSLGSFTSPPYQSIVSNMPPGSHTLTAVATDSGGLTATSSVVNITINSRPTVTIVTPTNRATFTEPTNLTITAMATNYSDVRITNVQIFSITNSWGQGSPTGTNFSITTNLYAGVYPIMAIATDSNGVTTFSETVVFTVNSTNTPPYVAITFPTNNESFVADSDITITAVATNSDNSITNVGFYSNGQFLGNCSNAPYTITICCWKSGEYVLTAVAQDSHGASGVSSNVNIQVGDPATQQITNFWDTSIVVPLDDGIVPIVSAMASSGPNLYVGAYYIGDDFYSILWKWDGTSWYEIGDPTHLGLTTIQAIAIDNTNIYVSGATNLGGSDYYSWIVMKWDGSNWTNIGNSLDCGVSGEGYRVHSDIGLMSLAFVGSDLYAGGSFTNAGGDDTVQYIARLNKTANIWESVGDGLNGPVYSITSFDDNLVIGGAFTTNTGGNTNLNGIAQLAGNAWTNLGTGFGPDSVVWDGYGPFVWALASCHSNLFAGGYFRSASGNTNIESVAVWNGTIWEPVAVDWTSDYSSSGEASLQYPLIIYSISARGDTVYFDGRFSGALGSDGNEVTAINVGKATWKEELQTWIFSDLSLGAYETPSIPFLNELTNGAALASAIIASPTNDAYSVFFGGAFGEVGVGECRASPSPVGPWAAPFHLRRHEW